MQSRQPFYQIISIFLLLTACTSSQAIESQTTTAQKLDLTFVQRVNIINVTADEITLVANGQLPNSCSNIEKTDIEHNGDAIIVSLYTVLTENDECDIDPINFKEEITINLIGYHETSYTVIVNGISTTAVVPATSISNTVLESTPSPTIDPLISTEENANIDEKVEATEGHPSDISQISPTAPQTAQPTETAEEKEQEGAEEAQATKAVQEPQPTNDPTDSDAGGEECINKAAFYADVTVPDNTIFKPGDAFEKIWRVRNEGTCTWDDGYTLVFAGGEIMNGSLSNRIPVVAPGEISDISIELKAPTRWGQYTGNWNFENGRGQRFGVGVGGHDYIWVQIFVDSPAPAPRYNSPAAPQPESQSETPKQTAASCSVEPNTSYEQQVLSLINNARIDRDLNPLNIQSQLSSAAYVHSSDMACSDFIGHTGSDASSWYDRVFAQGYANYNSARENIYVGDPNFGGTPQGAYNWWMNSQVHRDNILNPNVSEIGIGYVFYSNSSYGGYYTTVFARP